MKALLKNKNGTTLVEVVIAVALLTVISSAIVGSMYSSHRVTLSNYNKRAEYEKAVSRMDQELSSASMPTGDNVDIVVNFPTGASSTVPCTKVVEKNMTGGSLSVGIVKKN